MLSQAGRVHADYEQQGNFKRLSEYCNNLARKQGCIRRVALVETTLNKYARSERFRKTHKEITSKVRPIKCVYLGTVKAKRDKSLHF